MNLLRDLLLLAIVACAVTLLASAAAWWAEEPRRLRRALRRALGRAADAELICHGAAAGLDLHGWRAAVAWERGGRTRTYDLDQLTGMELLVDGQVAARASRDSERRALDHVARQAQEAVLRLVFDDAHDPDFQIWLWRSDDASRSAFADPSSAIQEGRRWLARGEALMRPSGRASPRPALEESAGELGGSEAW